MTLEEVTTLKEAIKRLKEVIKEVRSTIQPFLYDNEAKDYILKALEQEPCEDCISRKAVLDGIDTYINKTQSTGTRDDFISFAELVVKVLPSVNPQEKTGHWIADVDKWGDIVTTVNGYRCNKCNTFNADKDNYCPNCGCHMIEPQESEE